MPVQRVTTAATSSLRDAAAYSTAPLLASATDAAASSMRSIALSGKKRSAMKRAESCAAASIAVSSIVTR